MQCVCAGNEEFELDHTLSSTCRCWGGTLESSLFSHCAGAPQGFYCGGEEKELALFCLFLCVSSLRELHRAALRGPQRPKKQDPRSSQMSKLSWKQPGVCGVAPARLSHLQVESSWFFCTGVPFISFLGGPPLPTAALQLLQFLFPPVCFLPLVQRMFLDCTHESLNHLLRPCGGSSFTENELQLLTWEGHS